jgi:hypothetical protein
VWSFAVFDQALREEKLDDRGAATGAMFAGPMCAMARARWFWLMQHDSDPFSLSAAELRFLLQIGDAGMVALHPREDHVIARVIDLGLVIAEDVDGETALLRLTQEGQTVAARLRDSMG